MAKKINTSFNFGANVKPRKPKKSKGSSTGRKSNAWSQYVRGTRP
jgi:hypothetical protein